MEVEVGAPCSSDTDCASIEGSVCGAGGVCECSPQNTAVNGRCGTDEQPCKIIKDIHL